MSLADLVLIGAALVLFIWVTVRNFRKDKERD